MKTHEKDDTYHRWIAHDNFELHSLNMYVFNVFKRRPDMLSNKPLESRGLYVNNNWLRLY